MGIGGGYRDTYPTQAALDLCYIHALLRLRCRLPLTTKKTPPHSHPQPPKNTIYIGFASLPLSCEGQRLAP